MQGELSVNKNAYGRYHVALDISSEDYEGIQDGLGRPIPFQINSDDGVTLSVKLVDSLAFEDLYFNAGDNPPLVIAVESAAISANIKASFPYKPATTTINVTD